MNQFTVRVTKRELEATKFCGLTIDGYLHEVCAIQMAIREIFPEANVLKDRIFIDDEAEEMNDFIALPSAAIEFIKAFDAASPEERIKMEKLQFEIEPDDVPAVMEEPQFETA